VTGPVLGSFSEIAEHYADAAAWDRQAADQGDAFAQRGLGRLYRNGQGVPQDFSQAYKWSRATADQGDPLGEVVLASLNVLGEGRPVDAREAVVWARRAAKQDCALKFRIQAICAQAQAMLGAAYLDGKGVSQDYLLAYMWANLAAATLRSATSEERRSRSETTPRAR
jgi:TPR repeat protein